MDIAVLASGEGSSNLQALLDRVNGRDRIRIVAVASDELEAGALRRADRAGIPTAAFPGEAHPDRRARDLAMADWFAEQGVELVVLAGYMQLLSPGFLDRFPAAVINLHPALLPAFPGLHALERALAHGVKVFGATVHFVDEGTDTGPIILQRAVELPGARVVDDVLPHQQPVERDILCEAVQMIAAGKVHFDPANQRRVLIGRRTC